jgi:hypothetical protein
MKHNKHPRLTAIAVIALFAACRGDTGGTADEAGGATDTGTATLTDSSDPSTSQGTTAETSTTSTTSTTSPDTDEPCVDARDCDNGVFCDGIEDCVDGVCVPGEPVVCEDDGIDCTVEVCHPELDECIHQPSNDRCDCGETCSATLGCGDHCVVATCMGHVYECGDCVDNDGDCKIDAADPNCFGPCDDNESGWDGQLPGQQNQSPCLIMDCYFDFDSGTGNDDCYWSHACDPLEPSSCTYNENHSLPGTNRSCGQLMNEQSEKCNDYCGPLTPNGCDCFGCCEVPIDDQNTVTVYLGSGTESGSGTCDFENVADPEKCYPCTQVQGCLNPCEHCELCIGKLELPPDCMEQECPRDFQACGLPGQDPCPEGLFCNTGCCTPNPQ